VEEAALFTIPNNCKILAEKGRFGGKLDFHAYKYTLIEEKCIWKKFNKSPG